MCKEDNNHNNNNNTITNNHNNNNHQANLVQGKRTKRIDQKGMKVECLRVQQVQLGVEAVLLQVEVLVGMRVGGLHPRATAREGRR